MKADAYIELATFCGVWFGAFAAAYSGSARAAGLVTLGIIFLFFTADKIWGPFS